MAGARIGIDLGGTKIEAAVLARDGGIGLRRRIATPRGAYTPIVEAVARLAEEAARAAGDPRAPVGVGIPGSIAADTGRVRNANAVELNGQKFAEDLSAALGREVRISNDANCLAAAEAGPGGAADGVGVVFAVILGTGCGGGIAIGGRVHEGINRIAGEWGHTPLPWPEPDEYPGHTCWCGRRNCLETWVAGPALAREAGAATGHEAVARAEAGDARAAEAVRRHADRLARGLAGIMNVLDPEAIVLGGGVSNLMHLYDQVPKLWPGRVLSETIRTPLLRARQGDSAGVIGAARLWE
jgi:fructokinase